MILRPILDPKIGIYIYVYFFLKGHILGAIPDPSWTHLGPMLEPILASIAFTKYSPA